MLASIERQSLTFKLFPAMEHKQHHRRPLLQMLFESGIKHYTKLSYLRSAVNSEGTEIKVTQWNVKVWMVEDIPLYMGVHRSAVTHVQSRKLWTKEASLCENVNVVNAPLVARLCGQLYWLEESTPKLNICLTFNEARAHVRVQLVTFHLLSVQILSKPLLINDNIFLWAKSEWLGGSVGGAQQERPEFKSQSRFRVFLCRVCMISFCPRWNSTFLPLSKNILNEAD